MDLLPILLVCPPSCGALSLAGLSAFEGPSKAEGGLTLLLQDHMPNDGDNHTGRVLSGLALPSSTGAGARTGPFTLEATLETPRSTRAAGSAAALRKD